MIKTLILAMSASCGLTFAASAQSSPTAYPTHTVRVIVPFAAGGGSDALSRLLAEALQKDLGQPFIVDNVGGAGGTLGVSQAARANPDGYTILAATPSITINPYLQKNTGYNPIKDFDAVIQATTSPAVLVVKADSSFKSVQDVIDFARANPGDINYGTAGIGSFAHLSTALFGSMTNTKLTHIPYRGTGPALIDLLGGRLQVQFENAPGVLSQVKSGQLRAIAVGTAQKSTILPDIPTIAATVPGYESSSWLGILVPAGTPRSIIDKLNAVVNKALADPEMGKKLSELGVERVGGTPEQFGAYLKAKVDEMAIIAKAADLQPQ